jgi:hypothetical protein
VNHRLFIVAAVSDRGNSFGLHGHVLVAPDGEAWEVARSRAAGLDDWKRGDLLSIRLDDAGRPMWAWYSCELPRRLPNAPAKVLRELFEKPLPPEQ